MQNKLLIFIPSIEDGGVEKNLFLLSNYLSKKINSVEILSCNYNYKYLFNKKIKFSGTRSKFFFNKSRYIKYLVCLFVLALNIIRDRNVTVFAFQANIYAIFISKLLGIKIITRSNSAPQGWSNNYLKQIIFGFLLRRADSIIVNSIKFKKEMDNRYKINSNFIYNPFDKEFIKEKLKKKFNFSFYKKEYTKIISIGRMTDQKDHLTLLKAFSLVVKKINAKLLIIGKGKLEYSLKDYILNNNLSNNVKLLGYTNNPYNYLKNSDIFVLSSKFEGLPNVLLEAQFLKKYIISTDCPTGPKEILLNGVCGDLFKVGDYYKLAELIISYKKRSNKIKKKIKIGTENFGRFNKLINCNKYYQLLEPFL
jgi:glycosyltransferase involved in cell wall biosynthesis